MKKKHKKRISVFLDIILVAALTTAAYSGYRLYDGLKNYKEIDTTYEKIREEVKPVTQTSAEQDTDQGPDWEALQKINPDVAGWIFLADSTIDYPVVYASDNSWYLNHLFDGTYNPGGSIFVDARNARGFTDRNTVIYGHHMNNDSMFNNVEKYEDPSYYAGHKVIKLQTPEASYELHPVAGAVRRGTDSYVQFNFGNEDEFQKYVQTFINDSTFQSDETIQEGDQTVLLSTCTYQIQNGRYALLCRLIRVS